MKAPPPIINNNGRLGIDTDFLSDAIWDGAGGFAAYDGDHTVRLGNSTETINWDANSFLKDLTFGHYTATGTVVWDRPIDAPAAHTIYVERGRGGNRADVVFTKPIDFSGATQGQIAYIKGNGRMDIADSLTHGNNDGSDIYNNLIIQGAELRFSGQGRLYDRALNHGGGHFSLVTIKAYMGGRITIDDIGTYNSATGGAYIPNRISYFTSFDFYSSSLHYYGAASGNSFQELGPLFLMGGANEFYIRHNSGSANYTEILTPTMQRYTGPARETTLNFSGNRSFGSGAAGTGVRFRILANGGYLPDMIGGIAPWATVQAFDWATHTGVYAHALANYHTGGQATWAASHNVSSYAISSLSDSRTINSLKLGGTLNLEGHGLTLNSGGLLVPSGRNAVINGKTWPTPYLNTITAYSNRTLFAHIYGGLTLRNGARFELPNSSFVKTGTGRLVLDSWETHNFGRLFIYQGVLELKNGYINAPHIHIGDQAGSDILVLRSGINPLLGSPSVELIGSPFSRPELGHNPATLRMGGGTRQKLSNLSVFGQGVIDFVGGEVGRANILWVDLLQLYSGILFIRNWYQYEDFLLVKRIAFNSSMLPRIIFEGYEDYGAIAIDFDKDYYQITPFESKYPEPSTYGAILSATGLGLFAWRRRRKQQARPHKAP